MLKYKIVTEAFSRLVSIVVSYDVCGAKPARWYVPKSQGPQASAFVSWENDYHWLWLRSYIENLSALTAYELKNATLLLT